MNRLEEKVALTTVAKGVVGPKADDAAKQQPAGELSLEHETGGATEKR